MKIAAFILSFIFIIFTFIGAGYILYKHGSVNAGFAVVPAVFALVSVSFYLRKKN